MTEPIFWLVCSFLLVAVCLTAVLMAAIPALRELGRASRSAEKLFDTLHRELPPTLEAIRSTGSEISDLTDDLSDGVESAGNVVKQVDQSLRVAQRQVQEAAITTRSVWAGFQAAWSSLRKTSHRPNRPSHTQTPPSRSERRMTTGDRIASRNHTQSPRSESTSKIQRPQGPHSVSPTPQPEFAELEPPLSSVKPSLHSRAEIRDPSDTLEKRFESLPEHSDPSELE